ncbi:hypothetical protein Sste5346_000553 [Sporothrix stenoceras]|uniref:DUF676 domain-containing protein n=1 Tax=Sporothrix stenoceras TaxID=5173 RepID=A0ABR3ZUC6_9PEZI
MNWDLATEEPNRAEQFGQFGSLSVNVSRKDVRCRVVAVSGLASNPHWEWTSYSPETRIACNWLSELLPKHAKGATIETFRYNLLPGSVGGFLSEEGLTSAANRLLKMLDRSSGMLRAAPIVFVAHDLGGIVVKKIFFGTPHRALDEGSWEDLVLSIILASPAKLRMIPNLSTRLGRLSHFLEEVSGEFLDVAVDCRFINIYQDVDGESKDQPVRKPSDMTSW